jgi:hypothetical protein
MPPHVVDRAGRRFPGMMMRADFAVAPGKQVAQDGRRARVRRNRVGDDVGRPDAMFREERVEARERVQVFEGLVAARLRVPLVVAFRVDTYEEVHQINGVWLAG